MDGKLYHPNTNQKKAGVAILISDRGNFKARKMIRDKEWHYIVMKVSLFKTWYFSTCMYLTKECQNR